MVKLREALVNTLSQATGIEPDKIDGMVTPPRQPEHGDLAFPCFVYAKEQKANPAAVASQLAASLKLPTGFAEVGAIGPFLNFKFDRAAFLELVVGEVLEQKERYGSAPANQQTMLVDFSSPNIAKPFHVGHLRTTLIGWSLCRIFEFLGHPVVGINHLGDWGTQFGYVFVGCRRWGRPAEDDPSPVQTLVDRYVAASAAKKEDPTVEAQARDFFRRLEAGEAEAREFWNYARNVSLDEFKRIYERLGIRFDHYMGESFFNDKMEQTMAEVEASGVGKHSEGAYGVDLGDDLGFALLRKADGATLYLTRDLCAVDYRYHEFGFHKAVYVVGAPQALHFRQLIALAKKLGKPYADDIVHVPFGHIHGMSTRSGGAVALQEFLDEAHSRALKAFHEAEKRPAEGLDEEEVAERIGLSAIVFNDLSRGRIKDIHFDWDQVLSFKGDTGPYLQNAHARVNGIAEKTGAGLPASFDGSLLPEAEAFRVAVQLSRFGEVVRKAAEAYEPSVISNYLIDLVHSFSRAYEELKVKDQEPALRDNRFALFAACQQTLANGLRLLGITPLERM